MKKESKILILGGNGLLGKRLNKYLIDNGYTNILSPNSNELDCISQDSVNSYFKNTKPEYIFLAAAKVSGISDQIKYPADHGYINCMIILNVFNAGVIYGCKKVLLVGSAAMYPKDAPQPIKEDCLLTGKLDDALEMYGLSKLFGCRLAKAYRVQYPDTKIISCTPCNIYGPECNLSSGRSHVIASLIDKFYKAKKNGVESVTMWGSGNARREFIHVDDISDACHFLMKFYDGVDTINIGVGKDYSIKDISDIVKDLVDYKGNVVWDSSMPEGVMKRILDSTNINKLGWHHSISITQGIKSTYDWYKKHAI